MRGICICGLVCIASSLAAGQPSFVLVEVSSSRGIGPYTMAMGMSAGVAAADFDDDGDIDLFVPTAAGMANQLYRNLGNGSFEEIASQVGLDDMGNARVAIWFDADGDGRLDLVVAQDAFQQDSVIIQTSLRLYHQGADGQFVDVTEAAGLYGPLGITEDTHCGGIAVGDLTGNGFLDLVFAQWEGRTRLFLNNGDGTFTDASDSSGLAGPQGVLDYTWQPVLHDFNGDGLLDISMTVDYTANQLWLNQGDGTFVDVAALVGADSAWNEMGQALGDYDADGDIDLYATNMERVLSGVYQHNILLRNDSVGSSLAFAEISTDLKIDAGGVGWGTTFADLDRDADLDLIACSMTETLLTHRTNKIFLQNSSGWFDDASIEVGFGDFDWGSGVVAADLDRDGDLDVIQIIGTGEVRIWENRPTAGAPLRHALTIRPRMDGPNARAIGAIVRARTGTLTQTRLITAGLSIMSQEPAEAHFGLDAAPMVDELTIWWPNGTTDTLLDVPADQTLTVVASCSSPDGICCAGDLSGSSDPNSPQYGVPDGLVDANDFFYYLDRFALGDLAVADLTGSADPNDPLYGIPDGVIDASDFFYYLALFAQGCP